MHLAGCHYHVYNRGCNRERIFADSGNYEFLLRRAKTLLADYPLRVIANLEADALEYAKVGVKR